MSTSEFVKIANFAHPADAEQIRSILEENEIAAFVHGANTVTTLSHMGSALGGVSVMVRAADVPRAQEVLDSLQEAGSGEAWFCETCREVVDAGFDICWSCGAERPEHETPLPADVMEARAEAAEEEAQTPLPELSPSERSNPFASPRTGLQDGTSATMRDEENLEVASAEAEAMLARAWRASILGSAFLPIVAHFYSMSLLIKAVDRNPQFSPQGQRRFYLAFVVNILASCFWGMALWMLLG